MDPNLNLSLAGLALAVAVFCGWRGMQPSNPLRKVRLIPWRPLMAASFTAFMLLVLVFVHTRHDG